MRAPGAFALVVSLCPTAQANLPPKDGFWHETVSPHFQVKHQAALMPPGFIMGLEKIHSRLRLDLAMFAPWVAKERLKLYLYEDRKSYLGGEFKPPAWSNGIAFHKEKLVAVYDQANRRKLFEIIAHETTHLLFEGYWWESGKPPPQWLNEGLAMMEENEDPRTPEKSEWFQTQALLNPDKTIPFKEFIEIRPTQDMKDQDKDSVSLWYVQAFSLVHFLYREHSRLQFQRFCKLLRDGGEIDEVIWKVYRYPGSAGLDRAWKSWLRNPTTVARMRKYIKPSASYAKEEPAEELLSGRGHIGPGGTLRRLKKTKGFNFSFETMGGKN